MALVTDRSVFLHIPKAGGTWIRHAFKVLEIEHWEVSDQHSHFPRLGERGGLFAYHDDEYYKSRFIFTFVRHPLTWYQSRWAFRIKHGWRPMLHPLDYHCASNDFCVFVNNMLKYKPTGWVTEEYANFIDNIPWPINFVGRVENMISDLTKALELAGEKFDPVRLRKIPRINDSDLDGRSSRYWATYTKDLADRVLAADSRVISRYYHDYNIPTDIICQRPY